VLASRQRARNGLGGAETTGLCVLACERLKGVLGVDDPCNQMTTCMTTAPVERPVLEAMEGDVILLSSHMCAA
jgi:uroporphyrinogen decarboxylase